MPGWGFKETLGRIKYRKPQPVFCPRCGSDDMRRVQDFGMLPTKWRCGKCGYEGLIVLELEPDDSIKQGKDPEDDNSQT